MILYHGTSEKHWEPQSNVGYLFVSENLEHALFHASERGNEANSIPLIIVIDTDNLEREFRFLPDNDCHDLDGYTSWKDSLKGKGSVNPLHSSASHYEWSFQHLNSSLDGC